MVQLLPQEGDVDLHIVVLCVGLIAPDLQDQRFFGDHCVAVGHEQAHDLKLLAAQPDGALAAGAAALLAGERPQTGQQLFGFKGLGEVVVRAGVQPGHLVLQGGTGGEHQNGQSAAALADFSRHGQSVQLRQHHVQQHGVINAAQGVIQSALTVIAEVSGIVVGLQQIADGAGQSFFILYD